MPNLIPTLSLPLSLGWLTTLCAESLTERALGAAPLHFGPSNIPFRAYLRLGGGGGCRCCYHFYCRLPLLLACGRASRALRRRRHTTTTTTAKTTSTLQCGARSSTGRVVREQAKVCGVARRFQTASRLKRARNLPVAADMNFAAAATATHSACAAATDALYHTPVRLRTLSLSPSPSLTLSRARTHTNRQAGRQLEHRRAHK